MTVLDATTGTQPRAVAWPPRPPRRVAGIPVGLLVCWQAALVPALVAIGRPAGYVIGLGITAAVVVAVTGYRPRGRWVHEWVVLAVRYLVRAPSAAAVRQPPELQVLDMAVRTEAIDEIEIEDHQVAVVSHGFGCAAVLELDPGALPPGLPHLPLTLAPLREPDGPAVSIQLVVHATPAATAAPVRAWLAVQVRRDPAYPTAELRTALVSAVRRLRRRLHGAAPGGVEARTLDQAGLRQALHTVSGLELTAPIAPGVADAVGTEQWRTWWTRSVPHETLAIRSWPGQPGPPDPALFGAVLAVRCPRTVSIGARRARLPAAYGTARAGEEVLGIEVLVRLAERDRSALDAAVRELADRLAAVGAGIERLDGRQLPGLAATLPIGGFLPGYAPSAATAPRPRPARRHHARPQPAVRPAPDRPAAPAGPPPARPAFPASPPPAPARAATPPAAAAGRTATATPAAAPAPFEVATAAFGLPAAGRAASRDSAPVAIAQVHVPRPVPLPPAPVSPSPAGPPAVSPSSPASPSPAAPTSPSPAMPTSPPPARGHARVATPAAPEPAGTSRPAPAAASQPEPARAAVRGQAQVQPPSPPQSPPPQPPPAPPQPPPPPQPPQSQPPDAHTAVRAYGATLFTTESAQRGKVEQLVAVARTLHRVPQVVSVISGGKGLGASTTAAGVARTLATLRDDYTALLRAGIDHVDPATLREVCREHAYTIVDVGEHQGEPTAQALAASTRVVVVTSAERSATTATRRTLDRIHQVHPALVADAVIAVVCRTSRQYRRVAQGLSGDLSPQATRIVPVPHDPALRKMDQLNLPRLHTATREAYLRLAAAVAAPRPAPTSDGPPAGLIPHYPHP